MLREWITGMPLPGAARERGGAIAQSPMLATTITLERLAKRGYGSWLVSYVKVRPEQTAMGISFTS